MLLINELRCLEVYFDVVFTVCFGSDVGRILIRAVTKDWLPQGASAPSSRSPDFLGKEEHLVRVLTDLYNQKRVIIQSHEVLLVDDDCENVRLAQQFGHVAFKVEDDVKLSDMVSFVESLPMARSTDVVTLPTDNADIISSDGNHSSGSGAGANTLAECNAGVKSDGAAAVTSPSAGGELASEDAVQSDRRRFDDSQETLIEK